MATGEQQYKDFAARLYGKGFVRGAPTLGHFELTFRCPLECDFCYCKVYTSPEHTRREVTTAEAKAILDRAAEAGCLWMTLSGGDPFIRPDFREIYDHAIGLGLVVSIFCSGLIATDEWIEHLKKNPPFKIYLPLYGVTKETYEAVSGKRNTLERALQNIRKFADAGLSVRVNAKITRQNQHEATALKRFVEEELGLELNANWMLYPRLDGSRDHLAQRLDPLEVRKLEAIYGEMSCESSSESLAPDGESDPNAFRCAAGVNTFYINPYGELNFCSYVRSHAYDLKTGDLAEGMGLLRSELRSMVFDDTDDCKTCSIQSSCENCPGHAVLETGRLTGKSQQLCDENHQRRGMHPGASS